MQCASEHMFESKLQTCCKTCGCASRRRLSEWCYKLRERERERERASERDREGELSEQVYEAHKLVYTPPIGMDAFNCAGDGVSGVRNVDGVDRFVGRGWHGRAVAKSSRPPKPDGR
jgi:hypothetical protein